MSEAWPWLALLGARRLPWHKSRDGLAVRLEMTALFRKVDCHSIPVADLDAALAFYRDGLGHELIWRDDSAAGLRLPDSVMP